MFKMKKILFVVFSLLYGVAYSQVCADEDTVRSNAVSLITATTVRVNGTVAHFSGAPTSLQLRYVRVGQTDTATASSVPSTALRNLASLQAGTQYYYYYKTICGSGSVSQTIGAYTFTTLANTVLYAPERPTVFNHLKVDSSFIVPEGDTVVGREPSTRAQIRYKSSDNTFYGYYPDCTCWRALAIDSSGIIGLLDGKVDSVTVSGDSLFYWKVGVSYGYILPSVATVWHTTGNTGIDTSTDFIGTTDNVDFPIKTNDVRRFTVNTSGAWGIGQPPDYGTSGYLFQSAGSGSANTWVDHATLTTPLSKLTAATATNSIDNANYGQTWAWDSKTTGAGLTLSINGTTAGPGQIVLSVASSGANASANRSTYAGNFQNSKTGTNNNNYGINVQALGASGSNKAGAFDASGAATNNYGATFLASGGTNNYAGYFSASGGTNNYGVYSSDGNVSLNQASGQTYIGLAGTATGKLNFGGSTSGTVTIQPANAAGTWTMTLPTDDGTSGYYLQTDGAGVTSWQPAGGGITVGTTTITSGTNTKVLYNNSGVVGEYTVSGSGNVAMTTSPAFTTPDLGTPSALVGTNITGTAASLTAGNATTLATSRNLNNAAFNGSANVLVPDQNPSIMALLGSTILAEPVTGDVFKTASSSNLTDGQVRWVAVYIPAAITITGIKWIQQTQGNYTADNYNGVGLYSYSGGNITLVASSTDDGNIWKATSFTWSSKAFSSTYSASPGLYFAALIYNSSAQTTAPALRANQLSSDLLNTVDFTNSAKLGSSLTGQTTLPAGPSAMSTLTTNSAIPYLALY